MKGTNVMKDLKLCFVRRNWAYFTSAPVKDQWGDDWDVAPYEFSAGEPDRLKKSKTAPQILKVFFEAPDHVDPTCSDKDSKLSVSDINSGSSPWLSPAEWATSSASPVPAGATLEDFVKILRATGGEVYVPAP